MELSFLSPYLPLLWLIIAGASALVAGLTFTFWDQLKTFFSGKKLAILGARATGKTTLYNFLTDGELTGGTGIETTKSNAYKLKELKFYIKSGKDITGSEDFVSTWRDIIVNCDYTFYMIDSERIFNKDQPYMDLVEKQVSLIGRYYEDTARLDKVNIVCVFSDKVSAFLDSNESFEHTIKTRLERVLQHVNCYVFVGSLKNNQNKQDLVYSMLKTIMSS